MTRSRANVYARSWFKRECRLNMKQRRREYNRKIRHMKITEDSGSGEWKGVRKLCWDTIS
jgi:hypothetical protein